MPNELVLHNPQDRTNFAVFKYEYGTLTVSTHTLEIDTWEFTRVRLTQEQMVKIASWMLEERG